MGKLPIFDPVAMTGIYSEMTAKVNEEAVAAQTAGDED
jgi:hypothetical protein